MEVSEELAVGGGDPDLKVFAEDGHCSGLPTFCNVLVVRGVLMSAS